MTFANEINSILSKIGFTISRIGQLDTTQKLVRKLLEENFKIETVYDIGAFKGEYTKALQRILPDSTFYLFEANPIHEGSLKTLHQPYFIEVLSDIEKNEKWYSIGGTGDSLYRENQDVYDSITPIIRSTRTLDSLIEEHQLKLPDLIKLDVQGAEINVLRGGSKAVSNCSLICMEIPILNYNIGAPKVNEYLTYMESMGFIPIEVLEVHKASGVIIQLDIAFVRKDMWGKVSSLQGRNFLH